MLIDPIDDKSYREWLDTQASVMVPRQTAKPSKPAPTRRYRRGAYDLAAKTRTLKGRKDK
jgi:hypothetical protein